MKIFIIALLLAIGYAQTERRLLDEAAEKSQCSNDFSKKECRLIKSFQKCPFYYDNCQKTCGCVSDSEVEDLRVSAGIDDSSVQTGGSCLPNDDTTFADENGFGCRVYEGAGWCDGQGNYGERWCDWFPRSTWKPKDANHWCKLRKGRDRMTLFEDYSPVFEEPDARSCCCDGNLLDTYKADFETGFEDPSTTCEDYKVNGEPWHDDNGWSCAVYHYGNLCTSDGERGTGWKNQEWGTLQEHKFGKWHAKEACCTCGGGHTEQHWEILPAVNLRRIHKFAGKDFLPKYINRAKKHLNNLKALTDENILAYKPEHVQIIQTCITQVDGKPNQESTWVNFQSCWDDFKVALLATDPVAYNYLTK